MKDTLLRELSIFSYVSWILLEELFWNVELLSFHACAINAVNLVVIGQK